MSKHHPENERIKHRYRVYLQDARGQSEASIDKALSAIHAFETFTRHASFRKFHIEQARAFTRDLKARTNPATGKPYAKATLNGQLSDMRRFVAWLGGQPECRKRIAYGDADYFRLNEKDERIARATRQKRVPSVDEVERVIFAMPHGSDIEKRDRAVVAFSLLTCARVSAVASARLKHVDVTEALFHQDARDVKTKRSKTFTTWFFPVGDDIRLIVTDWIAHLTGALHFGPDDPLFPRTRLGHDENRHFVPIGLERENWATGQPIRAIIADAFRQEDLPPPSGQHVFRDTIAKLGEQRCPTPEAFKAWSQNMGHDQVLTTFTSYGQVSPERQAEIIRSIAKQDNATINRTGEPDPETVKWVFDHVGKAFGKKAND
ncbi:tyrosine-type recombinase/integrase [Tepidamorphus sp. 3E244]|uniref:tyrosine-type recombinase/integrase n=1 Tax=Tepidamorphus sp. 3E244 TaxID=3385498 RepID=UPI0038FCD994